MKTCSPYCAPLFLYIVTALASIAYQVKDMKNMKDRLKTIAFSLVPALLIGYVLYTLCLTCHSTIAWVLALYPFIMVALRELDHYLIRKKLIPDDYYF